MAIAPVTPKLSICFGLTVTSLSTLLGLHATPEASKPVHEQDTVPVSPRILRIFQRFLEHPMGQLLMMFKCQLVEMIGNWRGTCTTNGRSWERYRCYSGTLAALLRPKWFQLPKCTCATIFLWARAWCAFICFVWSSNIILILCVQSISGLGAPLLRFPKLNLQLMWPQRRLVPVVPRIKREATAIPRKGQWHPVDERCHWEWLCARPGMDVFRWLFLSPTAAILWWMYILRHGEFKIVCSNTFCSHRFLFYIHLPATTSHKSFVPMWVDKATSPPCSSICVERPKSASAVWLRLIPAGESWKFRIMLRKSGRQEARRI